jgi:hypothetical protein
MDKKRQKTSTFSSLLYCHPVELVLRYTHELLFPKPQLFTNVITFVVNIFFSHVVSFNNRLQFIFINFILYIFINTITKILFTTFFLFSIFSYTFRPHLQIFCFYTLKFWCPYHLKLTLFP